MSAISVRACPAIAATDWAEVEASLNAVGWATTPQLLAPAACRELRALYERDALFRTRVVMARHGFGQGEYSYFAYPLPPLVAALRQGLYPPLATIANRWNAALGAPERFPAEHAQYIDRCHAAGQTRPTPLVLRYRAGDYNCLHQDVYGPLVFPLQAVILLSERGAEFAGGRLVLTEQRPRMQSRAETPDFAQGQALIFPVRHRPVRGAHGVYRAAMRHGVSRLTAGERYTLGLIFHDAA